MTLVVYILIAGNGSARLCPVLDAIPDVLLQVNQTTTVTCRASGQPIPDITWKHQGRTIVSTNLSSPSGGLENPSYFNIITRTTGGDVAESILKLMNGQRVMAGRYSCEARNTRGKDMKEFDIQGE